MPIGEIPQSDALAEAKADSLSELFSLDPEGMTDAQFDRVITALRLQASRWAKGEAEKAARPGKAGKTLAVSAKAADLFG